MEVEVAGVVEDVENDESSHREIQGCSTVQGGL